MSIICTAEDSARRAEPTQPHVLLKHIIGYFRWLHFFCDIENDPVTCTVIAMCTYSHGIYYLNMICCVLKSSIYSVDLSMMIVT